MKNLDKFYPRTGIKEKKLFDMLFSQIDMERYDIETQYSVAGYFIDCYFREERLAIEFYEDFHSNTEDKDIKRQKEIEKLLTCRFIIIRESEWDIDPQNCIDKVKIYLGA